MPREDIYDLMFDAFCKRYLSIAKEVDGWYPSGEFEITVKLSDNTKLIYNDLDKTIQNVTRRDSDGYIMSEDTCRREFVYKLSEKMETRGITQSELADRSGVSTITVNKVLNCRQTPTIYTAYRLANGLNCRLHELIHF